MEEAVTDHLLAEAIPVEAGDERPRPVTDHPVLALPEHGSQRAKAVEPCASALLMIKHGRLLRFILGLLDDRASVRAGLQGVHQLITKQGLHQRGE